MRTSRNLLKRPAMLTTLLCLVLALGGCRSRQTSLPQTSQPEASPTLAMKGYELYSWQVQDDWYFALVPGTNRIKTGEEVTSPKVRVQGLEALGEALDELPRGEQVFWSARLTPNMALEDDTIVRQIEKLCRKYGITLHRSEAPISSSFPPSATPTPIVLLQETGAVNSPPDIVTFEVTPNDRLSFGEMVTVNWCVRDAVQVFLCFRYSTRDPRGLREEGGGCFTHLPAQGSQILALTPFDGDDTYYAHFSLSATNGGLDPNDPNVLHDPVHRQADLHIPLTCTHQWFQSNSPRWCPQSPPQATEAVAQSFENGIMVYIPDHDGLPPNEVTAYYHDPEIGENRYATFLNIEPLEPAASVVPPDGLLMPDSLFYRVWHGIGSRGAVPLREKMGWATGGALPYLRLLQYEESPDDLDACYVGLPGGTVYRLDPRNRHWEEWE